MKEIISTINQDKFKIVAMQKFSNVNSFVQQVAINEGNNYMLLTCSDRVLRLYELRYEHLNFRKKVIYLRNEFQDVINRRKWMNAFFLRLNNNTVVIEQLQNKAGDQINISSSD